MPKSLNDRHKIYPRPCEKCTSREDKRGCMCNYWRDWFAYTWRTIQIEYGAAPWKIKTEAEMIHDAEARRQRKPKGSNKGNA